MQIKSYLKEFDITIDIWLNALDQYDEKDLYVQINKESWSLGQLYMHLIEETNWFLGQAEICSASDGNCSKEMTEKAKKMFRSNEFPNEQIKGMATVYNVPRHNNKSQLSSGFLEMKNRANKFDGEPSINRSLAKTEHPGLGYFSGIEWLKYSELHLRHHLRQKKRIDSFLKKNSLQYPGSAMETFELKYSITTFYIEAESFPDGVQKAHQTLHALVPYNEKRKYFGISYMGKNAFIVYKAAAQELAKGELSEHKLEEYIIKKGTYISITIHNFMDKIPKIGEAFKTLLTHPDIDPKGACIEWYLKNTDCKCMVKLE